MPTVNVKNMQGEKVSTMDLSPEIFAAEVNESLMHQAVVAYLAAQRQGTHKVKTRGEVRGGGRKPWKQKGTGRARIGTIRAPHWKGGGVVFGPSPRDYTKKMNRKARRQAIRSALSAKLANGELIVVDKYEFEKPRTKDMLTMLGNLEVAGKCALVLGENDQTVRYSANNLQQVNTLSAYSLNVYELLNCGPLIMSTEAVGIVEEVFA